MQTLSVSKTRANLRAVMGEVVADRAPVAIRRQRGEGEVMVSATEWESIEETLLVYRVGGAGEGQALEVSSYRHHY